MTFSSADYRRRAHLVAAFVVLIVAMAHYFMASGRFSDELTSLESRRSAQIALLAQSGAIEHRLEDLKRQERAIREQLQEVRRRIPPTAAEAEFLEVLSEHADRSGLTILDFVPGDTQEFGDYLKTQVRLTAVTEYTGFCQFLRELRQLERLCDVDRIQLTSQDAGVDTQSLELTLSIFHAAPVHVADAEGDALR